MADRSDQKHQKFRELAEKRANKAIDAILLIGNLSNRQLYVYEDDEVKRIVKALKEAIGEVEAKFKSPHGKSNRFKL